MWYNINKNGKEICYEIKSCQIKKRSAVLCNKVIQRKRDQSHKNHRETWKSGRSKEKGFDGFLMGEYFMRNSDPGTEFGTFISKTKN